MSDRKFTPGPWLAEVKQGLIYVREASKPTTYILEIPSSDEEFGGNPSGDLTAEDLANGQLASAAPELYAACKMALEHSCGCRSTTEPDWHSDKCYVPAARAALAKAVAPNE